MPPPSRQRGRCALVQLALATTLSLAPGAVASAPDAPLVTSLIDVRPLEPAAATIAMQHAEPEAIVIEHLAGGAPLVGHGVTLCACDLQSGLLDAWLTGAEREGWIAFLAVGGRIDLVSTPESPALLVCTLPTQTIDGFSVVIASGEHEHGGWFDVFLDQMREILERMDAHPCDSHDPPQHDDESGAPNNTDGFPTDDTY